MFGELAPVMANFEVRGDSELFRVAALGELTMG